MRFLQIKKYEILVSVASLGMLCYLVFHGFYGSRGYAYRDNLLAQLGVLQGESSGVAKQRETIEARVSLLRPESIDPDYLDELARKDLFLVKPTDVIVALTP